MNILIREMKSNRKSLIFWSIGFLLMVAGGMGKYSAYASSDMSINDMILQMPKAMRVMLGFGLFDLSKVSGFFGMLFYYLIIMAAIHAVMLGANIISKEESDKTSEFLLVKPISRSTIIFSKITAGLVNIVIVNLVTLIASVYMVNYYSKDENVSKEILLLMISMFFLQVIFFLIGTTIAAIIRNPKKASSCAMSIMLVTFILSQIIDLTTNLEFLGYFTPFKCFQADKILSGGGFDVISLLLSAVIVVIMICLTLNFYKKRDMSI